MNEKRKGGDKVIFPMTFHSSSNVQTEKCGADFARYLLTEHKNGTCDFIAMFGDLGAGKTAFVRGAASVLSPLAHVQSPTYTVVNEYRGTDCDLLHFDFYRIEDEDSLDSIGYYDYLDRNAVLFGEWSERIPYAIPKRNYAVFIEKTDDDNSRLIRIEKRF